MGLFFLYSYIIFHESQYTGLMASNWYIICFYGCHLKKKRKIRAGRIGYYFIIKMRKRVSEPVTSWSTYNKPNTSFFIHTTTLNPIVLDRNNLKCIMFEQKKHRIGFQRQHERIYSVFSFECLPLKIFLWALLSGRLSFLFQD